MTEHDHVPTSFPEIRVNGWPIAYKPENHYETFEDDRIAIVVGPEVPEPLLRAGSVVQLEIVGHVKTSPFLVNTVRAWRSGRRQGFPVELIPAEAGQEPRSHERILFDAALESILGRVRTEALLELLIAKGLMTRDEFRDRFYDVVDRSLVGFASEVVPVEDAEAIREELLRGRETSGDSAGAGKPAA